MSLNAATNQFLERYKTWGYPQTLTVPRLPWIIRVNTIKVTDEQCLKQIQGTYKKIEYLDHGYLINTSFNITSSVPYLFGHLFVQEAASQIAAQVLNPTKNDKVLDMCAAPGGKTTQLAALMENQNELFVVEKDATRAQKLLYNLERCGVKNAIVSIRDASYAFDLGTFDKILLDAPCSGNFVIDPDWFNKRAIADFAAMAINQKKLLNAAIRALNPGGRILYATCSLEIEENEQVVESVLSDALYLVETKLEVGVPGLTHKTKLCRRFWPSLTNTQGFFVALLEKKA